MTSTTTEHKKSFFSCCAGEEEHKQAVIDFSQKKVYQQVPAQSVVYQSVPFYNSSATKYVKPAIRFSYGSPVQQTRVGGGSYEQWSNKY